MVSFEVPKQFHTLVFQGGVQAGSGESSTCFIACKSRIGNLFTFTSEQCVDMHISCG